MFALTERHRYYLYADACDMRKGFNGLSGLVRNELGADPLNGNVFVFINRSRQLMKLLVWDTDGYLLYTKRLEAGRFQTHLNKENAVINYQELHCLLRGIDLQSIKKRKRFFLPKSG